MILVDAGPIVALVHRDDRNHERCRDALRSIREPLGTAWPILTESMYLLGFSWLAQEAVWDMVLTGGLELLPLGAGDGPRMRELMRKYRELPMDLADAALVTIAEREGIRQVFTVDRRDFTIYRPARIGRFSIIP